MNFIDEKFFKIIEEFEVLPKEEIEKKMVLFYKFLPSNIKKSLENFLKSYNFWGTLDEANEDFDIFKKKAQIFKEKREDFVWLYDSLKDYKSKAVLLSILNDYYNFDLNGLNLVADKIYKHYFDLDLLPFCKNEVFVDVGAYTGDTVLDYIASYGMSYNKIYCYEITESMVLYMKNNFSNLPNVEIRNLAVAERVGKLYLDANSTSASANRVKEAGVDAVNAVSLDEDIKEKISMIKMDIEGGEISAIKGVKEHIKNDLPKLFISVYHSNDDIITIPKLIQSYTDKYDFYLRYYGGNLYATEIVLICLPK
mgnify:FL=1